ncbi:hypothetical protein MTR67_005867 [Solanum verrucosum]|uniref:ABC transmembrane type-1 domain-containing protein n=1 Tax=Solanum verrucosum TaxID=315347 RepID=A0AAF0PX56_SOLVR|nr:hypothetical protein MTR67_005867 [Solanum verrucosum]
MQESGEIVFSRKIREYRRQTDKTKKKNLLIVNVLEWRYIYREKKKKGEKQVLEEYNKSLQKAYRSGIDEVLSSGLGVGSSQFILFCNYALALWYGGKMILEKDYTGGSVLTITLAVLTASMSIGDASLCFAAFAAGKAGAGAGAFKMLETINRNLEIDVYNSGIIFYDICGDIEIKTFSREFCYEVSTRDEFGRRRRGEFLTAEEFWLLCSV